MQQSFLKYNLHGYSDEGVKSLEHELYKLGYKEDIPDGLGGGPHIINQVLLFLSFHYDGVLDGIIAASLYDVLKLTLSKLYHWQNNHKPKADWRWRLFLARRKILGKQIRPAVDIYIYDKENTSISITLSVDREYSVEELKKIVEEAE